MKHTMILLGLCLMTICAQAQTAKQVLDKASAEMKKIQSLTAQFEVSINGKVDKGSILLQDTKFRTTTSENTIWFDGKTMWTYVHNDEEVNVTEPTSQQVARINPYSFMNMYKQGYDLAYGANSSTYYEVVMTAINANTSIQKVLLRINKVDYTPMYIMMGTSKTDLEISITSLKKSEKQPDSAFRFNKAQYPKVEVVDLR